jgi:hypothetical protein
MKDWSPFDGGRTIGTKGSEGGTILLDDELHADARITIEHGGWAPFSITCGVYGNMVHTRFFSSEAEARQQYGEMKAALLELVASLAEAPDLVVVGDLCSGFVERFP